MPEAAEDHLREEAERRFPGNKERQDRYVYGALRHKFGWRPRGEGGSKGKQEKSHDR